VNPEQARSLLEGVQRGEVGVDAALECLKDLQVEDLGFAKIDHQRRVRTGHAEVIYGAGKTPEQVAAIFARLAAVNDNVLCTRATPEAAAGVRALFPQAAYHTVSRVLFLDRSPVPSVGCVAVAAAGTSDLAVAEEAAISLEVLGSRVERLYDVGVAGIHRLFAHGEALGRCHCVVAVAGMEGALPSVIGGLVSVPVLAVPTSVGYGASFGGLAALLAMLNSCASGISVVNIDNGFGAAFQADLINRLAVGGLTRGAHP